MIEIFLTIVWIPYLFFRTKKALHMLQQNLYDDDFRYVKWIKKNFRKIMLSFDLVQVLLIFFILYIQKGILIPISFGIVYILLFIRSFGLSYKEVVKKPLVVTPRVKRLIFTSVLIYILTIYLSFEFKINYYVTLATLAYLQYFIVLISQKLNIPIELFVKENIDKELKVETEPHAEDKVEIIKTLIEEQKEKVIEVLDKSDRKEELADMLEIIIALSKLENSNLEEVIEVSKEKVKKRGAFNKKIYLEKVITK